MFKFLFGVAFGAAGYWAWQSFGRDLLGMGGDQESTYGGFSASPSTSSGSSFSSAPAGSSGSFSSPSSSPSSSNCSSSTRYRATSSARGGAHTAAAR